MAHSDYLHSMDPAAAIVSIILYQRLLYDPIDAAQKQAKPSR